MASMVGFDLWMYMDAYHYDINDVRMCVYIRIYIYNDTLYIYAHYVILYFPSYVHCTVFIYIYSPTMCLVKQISALYVLLKVSEMIVMLLWVFSWPS